MEMEMEMEMKMEVIFNNIDKAYTFSCPHCKLLIQVMANETACCIFRHGVYKETNQQISPHTGKVECDRLIETKSIIGCGKPFRFVNGNKLYVEICDYI
jgi:hypothetical protein